MRSVASTNIPAPTCSHDLHRRGHQRPNIKTTSPNLKKLLQSTDCGNCGGRVVVNAWQVHSGNCSCVVSVSAVQYC